MNNREFVFSDVVADNMVYHIRASYDNDHLFRHNGEKWTINHENLDQHADKLIIADFSTDPWNMFDEQIYADLEERKYNFLLLTYDPRRHQKYSKMFYFPYWYHHCKKTYANKFLGKSDDSGIKNFDLGCLNFGPRPHRIANFFCLMNKSYKDKISVSFHTNDLTYSYARQDDISLSADELEFWQNIKPTLPETKSSIYIWDLSIPQLLDSYLHLVTETTVMPGVFVTEKTWKPIITGTPFLIFGNPGTMYFLKENGVDIYDDVIDHSYYDNELDWRCRLEKIHTVLDDLIAQGADKIYKQLLPRARINQEKFHKGDFDIVYYKEIVSTLKECINTSI
jgi:hypothetical protein